MAERNPSRPWTDHEDALLREGVAKFGEQDRWKDIALSIPGRTNKACRKRWLHSLSPSLKKTAWTPEEDQRLLTLYDEHGPKWSLIARDIPGRTDDACSKRYREALDPKLKKDPWTPEEDERLCEAFKRHGNLWSAIGQELERSSLSCRNRWRLQERKRSAGRSQPYTSPRSNAAPPSLEPSTSQAVAFTQQSEPSSPTPGINVESAWPYDSYSASQTQSFDPLGSQPHSKRYQPSMDSSLSAALSAPPAAPRPLPDDTFMYYDQPVRSHHCHSQPTSQTTSPLFVVNNHIAPNDGSLSLGDYGMDTGGHQQHDPNLFNLDFTQPPFFPLGHNAGPPAMPFPNQALYQDAVGNNISPISPPYPLDSLSFGDQWKSPHFSSLFAGTLQEYSPSLLQTSVSSVATLEDLSSNNSSPYDISASISPASPAFDIPPELPLPLSDISSLGASPTGGESLLFSVPQAPTKRKRTVRTRPETNTATRLSSTLKLSDDPEVRPYACGHEHCWSNETLTSRARFQTSKELCDHHREGHTDVENRDKLFRCGLEGCDKSWKSVNGLQYHLQLSTFHFKRAVQNRYVGGSLQQFLSAPGSSGEAESDESGRKWTCHHENCFKAYRQPSGLRYHLKHGHPKDMHYQFESVPPALERELPKKAKKMRFPKDGDSATPSVAPSPSHVDNGSAPGTLPPAIASV